MNHAVAVFLNIFSCCWRATLPLVLCCCHLNLIILFVAYAMSCFVVFSVALLVAASRKDCNAV